MIRCAHRLLPQVFLATFLTFASVFALAAERAPALDYRLVGTELDREGSYVPGELNAYGFHEALYRQAAIAGVDPGQAADIVTLLPGNAPMVFGRYSAASAQLIVEIYKVERVGGKTGVYRAQFTPAHGALWANAGTYKAPGVPGNGADPFGRFADSGAVFSRVSFEAAEVILGHAMRYVSSPTAVLAVVVPHSSQTMNTQRNDMLRKVVDITVTNTLEPKWYVAAPPSFQDSGSSAAICLHPSGTCAGTPYLVAPAMVVFQEWKGGTLPGGLLARETLNAVSVTDESHFVFEDFLAAANVYALAASGVRSALGGEGATAVVESLLTLGMSGGDPVFNTTVNEAGLYAGLSAVRANGSLAEVQSSYAGAARSGEYRPLHQSDLAESYRDQSYSLVIEGDPLTGGTMNSISDFYLGDCDMNSPASECGQKSGAIPRKDTYAELDVARFYYQDTDPRR